MLLSLRRLAEEMDEADAPVNSAMEFEVISVYLSKLKTLMNPIHNYLQ